MAPSLTVWFDGGYPLCAREIAQMRRLDRRGAIRFVDLLARFHAEENGRLLSGAAAFGAMWRAVPILRPLGLLAGWPPLAPAFEAAYRRFLRLRPRLQRLFR